MENASVRDTEALQYVRHKFTLHGETRECGSLSSGK